MALWPAKTTYDGDFLFEIDPYRDFLIIDDLRALYEIQTIVDTKVAISPTVLKALVQRDVFEHEDALEKLDQIAEKRDWLGAPIYHRAQQLFKSE